MWEEPGGQKPTDTQQIWKEEWGMGTVCVAPPECVNHSHSSKFSESVNIWPSPQRTRAPVEKRRPCPTIAVISGISSRLGAVLTVSMYAFPCIQQPEALTEGLQELPCLKQVLLFPGTCNRLPNPRIYGNFLSASLLTTGTYYGYKHGSNCVWLLSELIYVLLILAQCVMVQEPCVAPIWACPRAH